MTYDDWKATDPRDAEPDVEQAQCDECGGDGRLDFMNVGGLRVREICPCCEGRGWVWVRP